MVVVAEFEKEIEELLQETDLEHQIPLVKQMLETSLGMSADGAERLNMKIASAAMAEMRAAFRLFAPYKDTPKVSVFGSARTAKNDPLWLMASSVAAEFARQNWMVVTGAGPGIMEAASYGAGVENALGVSIRLPFEEKPNETVHHIDRSVSMKYFFTRKLMLVKESLAFVSLPGGFGTMDEVYELLTLQQTGKMVPVPIVLLDKPGGTYWSGFKTFVEDELEAGGYVNDGDLDRVLITDSIEQAVKEVLEFWSNYHSLRWFDDVLMLRLKNAPNDEQLAKLNRDFSGLLLSGEIQRSKPFSVEIKEGDALELERITLKPVQREIGELHRLIRALNRLV